MVKLYSAISLILMILLTACSRPAAVSYDPDTLIAVEVGPDHYHIPLNHIVRPDTGSRLQIQTPIGQAFLIWPDRRGLYAADPDPGIWEYDSHRITVTWMPAHATAGAVPAAAALDRRIAMAQDGAIRRPSLDRAGLLAWVESNPDDGQLILVSHDRVSPVLIACQLHQIRQDCSLDTLRSNQDQLTLRFSWHYLSDWPELTHYALKQLDHWQD